MKTIIVTGGAGFIGSHLCKKLLDEGNRVIAVDNFQTSTSRNIEELFRNKNFIFFERDIIYPLYISEKVDQIYNLACPASPVQYQKNAINTIKTNTIGVTNMLGLAREKKARILQASTSEVYGDPEVSPQPETYRGNVNPHGPRACYDEGKRCAEALFFDYHRQHGVDIRVVRIFNTYGPNMHLDDGRVVSNFIVQALRNEDITMFGDGMQSRSFQYVDDLINGLIKMMNNEENFIGPVNLGNPNEFTMMELAQHILKLIPESQSKIVYKELPEDDPKQRRPDISLAKDRLKWEPTIMLDDGLVKTIEYFRKIV